MTGIAVLDVETTGLIPEAHDRIVEIAVIHLDEHLLPTAEYETLVNPGRDLGPTHLHGVRGRHVRDAPAFDSVADDVVHWIEERVIVGHNVDFDLRFLRAEFARLGHALPDVPRIDTFHATRQTLAQSCSNHGIRLTRSHTSIDDARATAALLRALVESGRLTISGLESLHPSVWPRLTYECTQHIRAQCAVSEERTAIAIRPGMTVCFTGESCLCYRGASLDKESATSIAQKAGYVVAGGVSHKVDLVIAADPDSLSGKARKAREYGIPIIGEKEFWDAVGIATTPRVHEEVGE